MFRQIVQSGRVVRGVVKPLLASELTDAGWNWVRTGRQAPIANHSGTGLELNPIVASLAEQ